MESSLQFRVFALSYAFEFFGLRVTGFSPCQLPRRLAFSSRCFFFESFSKGINLSTGIAPFKVWGLTIAEINKNVKWEVGVSVPRIGPLNQRMAAKVQRMIASQANLGYNDFKSAKAVTFMTEVIAAFICGADIKVI